MSTEFSATHPTAPPIPARPALFVWLAAMATVLAVSLVWPAPSAQAVTSPTPVALGVASTYSVLAGSSIVNTLTTTMTGDLGVSPGTAVTGFPPGIVSGSTHIGDTPAALAQGDAHDAYNDADGRTPTEEVSGDLNGHSFGPGVYHSPAALAVTGNLTLDAHDDPNAVFIFQVDSALNIGAASNINLINSGNACNVFWQVGSEATIGASSTFNGTVLANASVTVGAGTSVHGRVVSFAAITLADNDFNTSDCGEAPPGGDVTGASGAGAGADTGGVTGASGAGAGADTGGVTGASGAGAGADTGGVTGASGAGAGAGVGGADVTGSSVTGAEVITMGHQLKIPETGANPYLGTLIALGLVLVLSGGVLVTFEGNRLAVRKLLRSGGRIGRKP